jgi:hypothetical protein
VQFGVLLFPIYAQLYRYRHVSSTVEQQQTKWVVFGLVLTLLAEGMIFLPPLFFPTLAESGPPRALYVLISACLFPLLLNLIPLTIGIAVLRYRLWDVDALINHTLVYGLLTILLVLMYVAIVIVLQILLHAFFNQTNSIVLVASTLAIASVFQPLRRRVQSGIDRRFYRRKYNAAHTLAAFSARLRSRDDIDLTTLTGDLLKVVEETMQPAHVSLWLCSPERTSERVTQQLPGISEEDRRSS